MAFRDFNVNVCIFIACHISLNIYNIPDFDAKSITYPLFAILQISWIRLRDWHILTNGVVTYTTDSRFQVNCDI